MKTALLAILLAAGCELPDGDSNDELQCKPAPDGGMTGAPSCVPIACCALDGNTLLCPPDGIRCRDCRPDPAVRYFCCGVGCP